MNKDQLNECLKPYASRIKGMVTKGILESVNDENFIQLVKFTGVKGEVVSEAERIQPAGIATNPKPGANIIILANNGSKDHPVVIQVDNAEHRPKVTNPGDTTVYDEWGNTVVMDTNGVNINEGDKGVARLDDTTITDSATDAKMIAWIGLVTTAINALAPGSITPAQTPSTISGKINSASTSVKAGD